MIVIERSRLAFTDLRSFIAELEKRGQLQKIAEPVDPRYELAATLTKYDTGPAVLFENTKGHDMPVVAGIFSQRNMMACALGTSERYLVRTMIDASQRPLPTKMVQTGPAKEVAIKQGIDVAKLLPVPTHYEFDAGPYITAGVIIARDPGTGVRNASYARIQVRGGDRLGIMINRWRHLWEMYEKAESKGESLPIAVTIGAPPSVVIEGAMPGALVPITQDELDTAGALMGQPLEVVECETVDLTVPAASEIVIEGEILPKIREPEGPFGDYAGVYDGILRPRLEPVIRVSAVTHRKRPIYHDILPSSEDHLLLGGVPREAELHKTINQVFPRLKTVHLSKGGCRRFHAIIQIEKRSEADPRTVMEAAFYPTEGSRDFKLVIVVDEDIDPFNMTDVEWALATRVQANESITVFSGAAGALDPSAIVSSPKSVFSPPENSGVIPTVLTTKMGIDATKSLRDPSILKIYDKLKTVAKP